MNVVVISGRLVREPSIYNNGGVKNVKFNVAVQKDYKSKDGSYGTDFINCTAFGNTANFIESYFKKGSWIEIEGKINTGSYTNKDGIKVFTTDVIVNKAGFGGASKSENDKAAKADAPKAEDTGFMNIPDAVNDLPFGG